MPLSAFFATHPLIIAGTIAAVIAIAATMADIRHSRRRDLEKVSLVSWGQLSTLAMIVAIVFLAIGLRAVLQ